MLESAYRLELASTTSLISVRLFVSVFAVVAFAIACDLSRDHSGESSNFDARYGLAAASAGVVLLMLLFSRVDRLLSRNGLLQVTIAFASTLSGCLFVISTALHENDIGLVSSGVAALSWLCALHVAGKHLLLPYLLLVSWLVTICYIVAAALTRWTVEPTVQTVYELGFVGLANIVLCFGSHQFEAYRRLAYVCESLLYHVVKL